MSETLELKPVAVDLDTWTPTPDSTKWNRLDDHLLDAATANADYIAAPTTPDPTKFDTYQFEALTVDDSDRIVRVVLGIRVGATPNVTALVIYPRVRIGTVNVDLPGIALANLSGANVVTHRELLVDFTSHRPGGGAWLKSDFGSGAGKASFGMAAGYVHGGAFEPRVTCLWLPVTKQPVGVLLPAVRRAASVAAWRGRMIPVLAKATLGPRVGGSLELGDDVYASDRLAPTPEGTGWGIGLDQARPLQVRALEEDLTTHLVGVEALVLRGQAVLFADSGRTIGASRAPNGITRLEQGGVTETFERSSKAWVEQPDGLVGEVPIDEPALGKHGRLHEGRATNSCPWPAFQEGHTWSQLGSSTFVTDDALFTPEVGAQVINIPAGSTPVMSGITLPVGWTVLSFDYKTLAGCTAQVRIRRASNNDYYNVATDSWGASIVDNVLPAAAIRTRHDLRISHTGSGSTYSLRFTPTGGAMRVFHVQSEIARKGKGWPSSRIVNLGTAGTRSESYLELSNNDGARTWPGKDGTVRCRWRPGFNAHDAEGGGDFVLWHASIDADVGDEAELHYTPPADGSGHGLLQLVMTTGGFAPSTYDVGLQLDVVASVDYRIATRWQSRNQNGDAPGTISVWCEGVAARAAGPGDAVGFAVGSVIVRGGRDNGNGTQAEGVIWDEIAESAVLSDGELEEWR